MGFGPHPAFAQALRAFAQVRHFETPGGQNDCAWSECNRNQVWGSSVVQV